MLTWKGRNSSLQNKRNLKQQVSIVLVTHLRFTCDLLWLVCILKQFQVVWFVSKLLSTVASRHTSTIDIQYTWCMLSEIDIICPYEKDEIYSGLIKQSNRSKQKIEGVAHISPLVTRKITSSWTLSCNIVSATSAYYKTRQWLVPWTSEPIPTTC